MDAGRKILVVADSIHAKFALFVEEPLDHLGRPAAALHVQSQRTAMCGTRRTSVKTSPRRAMSRDTAVTEK